jgi:hypothetical protein
MGAVPILEVPGLDSGECIVTKRWIGIGGIILLMIAVVVWVVLPKHRDSIRVPTGVLATKLKPIDTPSNSGSMRMVASNLDKVPGGRDSVDPTVGSQTSLPRPPAPHPSNDMSVVGHRFAVSPSIDAGCNDPGLKAVHFCDRLQANLADMSKESRDSAWAADMETQLQDFVASQRYDPSSIRNVECRTSWCAIEVASIYKSFVGIFPYADPLMRQLDRDGYSWATGSEPDPTGATVHVVVQMYRRR